jgi:hypothetical protein
VGVRVGMSAQALLEDLRAKGVILSRQDDRLDYRGPAGAITPDTLAALRESKSQLLMLLRREERKAKQEWRKLEEAGRRGLVIKWAKEPGWITLHDPTTGEWHEVRARECLPSVVEAAKADARRKKAAR